MKFLNLLPFIGAFALAESSQLPMVGNYCEQGKVTLNSHLCVTVNYIEGCTKYAGPYQCKTCHSDYSLKDDKCNFSGHSSSDPHIPGCLVLDPASKTCKNCANGFLLENGKCKKGIKNCAVHNKDGTCQECKPEFSMMLGQCRHNVLLGCKSESSEHTCRECFSPFKLESNRCTIDKCSTFNDFGCTGCECGYYLTKKRDCKEAAQGCLRYQRGMCVNCMPHYKLKGGFCQIDGCKDYSGNNCEKCDSKYEKNAEGGCTFKNCYDWLDGECLVCNEGYRREGEECVKLTPDMLRCN